MKLLPVDCAQSYIIPGMIRFSVQITPRWMMELTFLHGVIILLQRTVATYAPALLLLPPQQSNSCQQEGQQRDAQRNVQHR